MKIPCATEQRGCARSSRPATPWNALAVLSGNVLMPLLYHSFKPQGIYLWSLYCKRSGIQKMYELKLNLYSTLLNRDVDKATEMTHFIMDTAIEELSFYGA